MTSKLEQHKIEHIQLGASTSPINRLGIGTATPQARLEIEDGGTTDSVLLKITADDQNPFGLVVGNDTFSTTETDGLSAYVYDDGRGTIDVRGTGAELRLSVQSVPKLTISDSNIGIGTISPQANLEIEDGGTANDVLVKITADDQSPFAWVVGNDTFSTTETDGLSAYLLNNGTGTIDIRGTGAQLSFAIQSVSALTIDNDSNVGIGATSPNAKLQIEKPLGAIGPSDIWLFGGGETDSSGRYNIYCIGHTINAAYDNDLDNAGLVLNFQGYQAGNTRYRDLVIYDGKNNAVVHVDGSSASMGVGVSPAFKLDILEDSASGYAANFFNDGDNINRYGIRIQAGADAGTGAGETTYYVRCYDGDGNEVGGLSEINGAFADYDISDRRLKDNILPAEIKGIDIINKLPVNTFTLKKNNTVDQIGFIAQDVQEAFPNAVSEDEEGMLRYSRSLLIPALVKAIQEQQVMIDEMKKQLNGLRGKSSYKVYNH